MYEKMSKFDRKIAKLGDRASIIAGLEITKKMSPEAALQEIRKLYKGLKKALDRQKDKNAE